MIGIRIASYYKGSLSDTYYYGLQVQRSLKEYVPRLTTFFCWYYRCGSTKSGMGAFCITNRRDRHDHDVTEYKLVLSFSSYGRLHRVLAQAVGKLQGKGTVDRGRFELSFEAKVPRVSSDTSLRMLDIARHSRLDCNTSFSKVCIRAD